MVGATFATPVSSKSFLKYYIQHPCSFLVDQSRLHLPSEIFGFNLRVFGIYSLGIHSFIHSFIHLFNKIGLGNISDLVELSGQNDKCSYFSLCTGKRSDNPMDPDWVPSVFSHKKAIPLSKLQAAAKKNHHRSASKKDNKILPDYMPLDLRILELKNPVMLMR